MEQSVLEWLTENDNPEVKLRTLKEYKKLSDYHFPLTISIQTVPYFIPPYKTII